MRQRDQTSYLLAIMEASMFATVASAQIVHFDPIVVAIITMDILVLLIFRFMPHQATDSSSTTSQTSCFAFMPTTTASDLNLHLVHSCSSEPSTATQPPSVACMPFVEDFEFDCLASPYSWLAELEVFSATVIEDFTPMYFSYNH